MFLKRRSTPVCVLLVALLSAGCGLRASGRPAARQPMDCDVRDAIAADAALDGLTDWRAVYDSFRRFSHCDDGGIAEGWSDIVARLLTLQWSTVSVAAELGTVDPPFRRFLLHHVDELMSPEQARSIVEAAEHRCPPDSRELCRQIVRQVRSLPRGGRL